MPGKRPKPPTKTIRVHLDVARMIDTCAAAEGKQAPEWLSELLRPILLERIPKSVDRLVRDPSRRKKGPEKEPD